jgi:hypothetical protein
MERSTLEKNNVTRSYVRVMMVILALILFRTSTLFFWWLSAYEHNDCLNEVPAYDQSCTLSWSHLTFGSWQSTLTGYTLGALLTGGLALIYCGIRLYKSTRLQQRQIAQSGNTATIAEYWPWGVLSMAVVAVFLLLVE